VVSPPLLKLGEFARCGSQLLVPSFLGIDLGTRGFIFLFSCVCNADRDTISGFSVFVVSTSATDCPERLVCKMTYYVWSGTFYLLA